MPFRVRRRHALLALTLLAAPAGAVEPTDGAVLLGASLSSLAAVLIAVAGHWGVRRIGRRWPRALARRAGTPTAPGAPLPWEGAIRLGMLVLAVALWLTVAIHVSNQFATLHHARRVFTHMVAMSLTSAMFVLNGHGYSALDLLELPAVLAVMWIVIGGLTRVLKVHVLRATRLERGLQDAVALLARYSLVFLGAIVVLQVWGIDASSLTFVAGVLGVGIGFGLQHIANNFVSGLVVSLERPIQPGDFVQVGEWSGTVERIGPRNTEIRTNDNVSILVPNSRFLETEVVNWTHGDPVCRLHVPVGVAYGSDIGQVRAALLEAARSHPDVLNDPRPRVGLRSFGESALNFALEVWTRDPRNQLRLTSDLNYRIEANLRRHRVAIPFPQQDLHLRSPQLEQMLAAVSRRYFSEAELTAESQGAVSDRSGELPWSANAFADEPEPRTWTADEIRSVVTRLRGPGGVSIMDRRHLLTVYRQCFVGREAVDWLTRTLGLTRAEAVDLGQLLIDQGIVSHVLDEHGFKDGHFFYRFCADAPAPAGPPAVLSA